VVPREEPLEIGLCAVSACVAAERLEEAEALYRKLAAQLRAAASRTVYPDPALLERVRADVPMIGYEQDYEALHAELIAAAAIRRAIARRWQPWRGSRTLLRRQLVDPVAHGEQALLARQLLPHLVPVALGRAHAGDAGG
jgi:hypothetical protein